MFRHLAAMRFGADHLRDQALLALEDAVQECRYRQPRSSYTVRFALAYLWATSKADRHAFDAFWADYRRPKSPWNFSCANIALTGIYVALGLERPRDIDMVMWRRWSEQEGSGGGGNRDRTER